jgi:hypothetical protein
MVAEEVSVNCVNFNPVTKIKKRYFFRYLIKLSGAGAVAGAAIRICRSMEPKPKEIISASQHW